MYQKKAWGCTSPTFLKLFCFLWFVPSNRLPACRYRKIRGDDSDPPPKRGFLLVPCSGAVYRASIRPQGVAIVCIYPCGKAWNSLTPWTAPGRSEGMAVYEGKGGFGPCGRAGREPFGQYQPP